MKTRKTSTFSRFKKGLLALILPAAMCTTVAQAQTVLLNPADSGGFEAGTGSFSDNGWATVGNASNDTWYTGSPGITNTFNPPIVGTRLAYIGPTAGTWGYGTGSGSFAAHMYKDITVPAGETQVFLTLKYQIKGSANNKFFIYLCPTNAVPVVGEPSGNGGSVSNNGWGAGTGVPLLLFASATPNVSTAPLTLKLPIPASYLNNCNNSKTFRIVFTSWRNNAGSSTNNPPVAVDSIKITSQMPVSSSASLYTINKTLPTSGTNFNNFTDAINWINAVSACGLNNSITFNVSAGQTFDENTPYLTASGTASNPIIFQKNGAGANPIIRPTGEYGGFMPTSSNPGQHDYGICLHGADYITFDGIDIIANNAAPSATGTSIAVEYGYLIRNASPTNGACNNTIKNTTIILDRTTYGLNGAAPNTKGIVQTANGSAAGGFSASNQFGTNDNNSYYNITIGNVNNGILLYGASSTLPDRNTKISTLAPGTFNHIGRTGVANDIGNNTNIIYGINLNYQYDAVISNNIIQNLTTTTTSSNNPIDGILIGFTSLTSASAGSAGINNEIANNQILNLMSTSASTQVNMTGMRIQFENIANLGGANFRIYNNVISNISSAYSGTATTSRLIKGLWLQAPPPSNGATIQFEVVNNTIVIDGTSSPGISNIVFQNDHPTSILKLRNNLFYNATGPQALASHTVLGITGATTAIGASGSISDYNDFYYANTTGGFISFNNSITSLANWQSTFSVDANSKSADPKLNSSTVLYPLLSSPLIASAPTLAPPYNRDIMGTLRGAGNSTIGAFEKVGDVVAPIIADTIIMGINSTANRSLPGLLKVIDDGGMVANTPGTAPRLYFKKSTDANTFGANNSSANGWKYVEAGNSTSPFDFTINYALLTSAVNTHDVIQYFFVAQDTVSSPNLVALPSSGFAGTSVGAITAAPTTPKSYIIYNTPAAFVSSTGTQANTFSVTQNNSNNAILRVEIQTAPTGDSAYITELNFNSSFSTDFTNIANAKIWYTGTSNTFNSSNTNNKQFGNTFTPTASGALGMMQFNSAQVIPPNATVYFWLTYDINQGATIGDSVDASVVSVKYNGATYFPTVLDPDGARMIKKSYCIPTLSGGRHISIVSFNTLNNNAGASYVSPFYVNYAPIGTATTSVKRGNTYNLSLTQTTASTSSVVYIDYNDNGNFEANEAVTISLYSGAAGTVSSAPVSIPCNAVVSSEIRMRVISYFTGSPWADACTQASAGEVQDYTITITDNPVDYVSSAASQFSGNAAASTTDKLMMRLPIVAQGCGTGFLTEVRCHTAKTMNTANNLQSAKLYSTGKSAAFSTNELLASVTTPSGAFVFTGFSDSLYGAAGDTNYYWIAYDLKATATLNDTIDVRIDSINATGRYVIPSNNNPVEYSLVKPFNTYTSSNVIHPVASRTPRLGQPNTPVLQIRIIGSTGGAPLQLKQLNFDPAGGGNDSLNIRAAKVFYTGKNSTFNTANQYGSTYTADAMSMTGNKWNSFTISGVQDLTFDTNYFWLAYDISPNASLSDSVDADLVSFNIGTSPTPTKNVTGALLIKPNYCFMGPSGGGPISSSSQPPTNFEEIINVTFGSINNSSTCSQTGGPGSILGQYSDYSDIVAPANISIGDTIPFTLSGVGNCNQPSPNNQNMGFVILIDWNQNGIFDATEVAYRSAVSTSIRTYTDKLFVPCNALPGNTRMRVIYGTGTNAANAGQLGINCGNTSGSVYVYGETEDYTINVQNNPVSTVLRSFVQVTGSIGKGVSDAPVLRVAIKPKGCGAELTAMHFAITGASLSDITAAKLYTTGSSNVFNTSTLLGSVSPAANIQFTGLTGAFVNNGLTDSTYFWLAYDIAPGATTANLLDGKIDSFSVGSTWYNTLTAGNPGGNRAIADRMAYSTTTVIQPDTNIVALGTLNKQILRINVQTNNTNGPVPITSLSFNVNGSGNNLLNVDSARVYFTGSSTTFSTATQFGSAYSAAPSAWGSFTINGLANATTQNNYFWLVYDIKATATPLDSVDAELTSVTFDGVVHPYTLGASSGNSKIRGNYCQTTHQGSNSAYYIFTSVTIAGTSTNSTARTIPFYIDNTATTTRNIPKGPNTLSVSVNDIGTGNSGGYTYVYIDFDQNGDFTGANELVASVPTPLGATNISYFVPCNVKAGLTRMRLTTSHSSTPPALCSMSAVYGETEDYTVNIQNSPLTFSLASAHQMSGTAIQGANDQVILNIKVRATGCGVPLLTNMYFNTVGSSNPAGDIVAAKLYKTGNSSIFNTSNLIGSVFSPNGAFNFASSALNDTLSPNNDTTYYWLAYDVAPTATNNDTIDVRVDSIIVMGTQRIPTNNNPAGFKKVLAPMTILGVSASHPSADRVAQGTNNFQALRIRVIASSTGATLPVTALNFNTTGGGYDLNNITSARVYYTGSNPDFGTTIPFGTTYTPGSNVTATDWLPFTVSGYQELLTDTNYFWLTFNLKPSATLGDSVDAEVPSMLIGGVIQPVTNAAPAGNSILRQEYCIPGNATLFGCLDTVRIGGTLENITVGTCVTYTNYPKSTTMTASAYAGSSLPISLSFSSPNRASVFIDLNKNGIFESGEEFNIAPSHIASVSTSIIIPANATLGETRLRIRTFGGNTTGGTDRACSAWNQSETEDYTITILPALPQATYTWNNAGTSDFAVPSNWIPARNAVNNSDNLVFNSSSTPLNITNVFNQKVASIELTQGTVVNMSATSAAELQTSGSLILNDSAKLNGNSNITVTIGESVGAVGSLTVGNASGINAKIKRWIGFPNSSDVAFPFIDANGTRRLHISYTFAPLSYGAIEATFIPTKATGNFGFPLYDAGIGSDLNKTCMEGYWNVQATNGLTGGAYTGTFWMDSVKALPNPYLLTVTNRSDVFSPWSINGNHSGASIMNGTSMISRIGIQGFGHFAIASDSSQNPLPVTLTSFTAAADKANAVVQWNTSSEVNNKGFDLERSVDGRSFEKVVFVKGNGTSAVSHKYAYNDENAFTNSASNILYYRLKQIDFDGRTTYSKVVRVASYMQQASAVSVYPNPFEDNYTVAVDLQNDTEVELVMTNIQGKTIATETIHAVKGSNNIPVTRFANLEAGVYFLRVSAGGESQVIKMIKK